jgi:hypothetical protein
MGDHYGRPFCDDALPVATTAPYDHPAEEQERSASDIFVAHRCESYNQVGDPLLPRSQPCVDGS